MSAYLICLTWSWHFNFHITTRHDPEAGHKRDIRCQLRHIKWVLILKLSMRPSSRHSPNPSEFFFPFPVSQLPCDFIPFMFQDFLENWALELNWTPLCHPFFAVTSCSVGSVSTSFEFLVIEASLDIEIRIEAYELPPKAAKFLGFFGCI